MEKENADIAGGETPELVASPKAAAAGGEGEGGGREEGVRESESRGRASEQTLHHGDSAPTRSLQLWEEWEELDSAEGRESFRQRLWDHLFGSLERAVDEIYLLCELESDAMHIGEALTLLAEAEADFSELRERVAAHEKLEESSPLGSSDDLEREAEGPAKAAMNAAEKKLATSAEQKRRQALAWEVRRIAGSPQRATVVSASLQALRTRHLGKYSEKLDSLRTQRRKAAKVQHEDANAETLHIVDSLKEDKSSQSAPDTGLNQFKSIAEPNHVEAQNYANGIISGDVCMKGEERKRDKGTNCERKEGDQLEKCPEIQVGKAREDAESLEGSPEVGRDTAKKRVGETETMTLCLEVANGGLGGGVKEEVKAGGDRVNGDDNELVFFDKENERKNLENIENCGGTACRRVVLNGEIEESDLGAQSQTVQELEALESKLQQNSNMDEERCGDDAGMEKRLSLEINSSSDVVDTIANKEENSGSRSSASVDAGKCGEGSKRGGEEEGEEGERRKGEDLQDVSQLVGDVKLKIGTPKATCNEEKPKARRKRDIGSKSHGEKEAVSKEQQLTAGSVVEEINGSSFVDGKGLPWREKKSWVDILVAAAANTTQPKSGKGVIGPLSRTALSSFSARKQRNAESFQRLHEKFMSPNRKKKTPLETQKEVDEKLLRASRSRQEMNDERQQRLQRSTERLRRVSEWQAVRRRRLREGMQRRQQDGDARHEAHLAERVRRAGDESSKVNEVRFIMSLSDENRKLSLQQKLENSEARRLGRLQSLRQKQREDGAREEAALERRKQLEAERQQKIAEAQKKKEEALSRREEERRAGAAQREARALEAARKKEERVKAQKEEAALMAQRLLERLQHSEARRQLYLSVIRERAAPSDATERRRCDSPDVAGRRHTGSASTADPTYRGSPGGRRRSSSIEGRLRGQSGGKESGESSSSDGKKDRRAIAPVVQKRRIKKIRQRLAARKFEFVESGLQDGGNGTHKAGNGRMAGIARSKIARWQHELQRQLEAKGVGGFTATEGTVAELIKFLEGRELELTIARQLGLIDYLATAIPASHTSRPQASRITAALLRLLRVLLTLPSSRYFVVSRNLLPPLIPMLAIALENFSSVSTASSAGGGLSLRGLANESSSEGGNKGATSAATTTGGVALQLSREGAVVGSEGEEGREFKVSLKVVKESQESPESFSESAYTLRASAERKGGAGGEEGIANDKGGGVVEGGGEVGGGVMSAGEDAGKIVLESLMWIVSAILSQPMAEERAGEMQDDLLELVVACDIVPRLRDLFAIFDCPHVEGAPMASPVLLGLNLLESMTANVANQQVLESQLRPKVEIEEDNRGLETTGEPKHGEEESKAGNSQKEASGEKEGVAALLLAVEKHPEELTGGSSLSEKTEPIMIGTEGGEFLTGGNVSANGTAPGGKLTGSSGSIIASRAAASVLAAMEETGLAGLPSLLTAVLLQANPPRGSPEQAAEALPPNFEVVATSVLRILNNIARGDLAMLQSCLQQPDLSVEFFHLVSFLLSHCTIQWKTSCDRIASLLNETLLLIAHFSLLHSQNQAVLRWGKNPTILHKLIDLPFIYFIEPSLTPSLLGTLAAACFKSEQNCRVVEQGLSLSWLHSYLNGEKNLFLEEEGPISNGPSSPSPAVHTTAARSHSLLQSFPAVKRPSKGSISMNGGGGAQGSSTHSQSVIARQLKNGAGGPVTFSPPWQTGSAASHGSQFRVRKEAGGGSQGVVTDTETVISHDFFFLSSGFRDRAVNFFAAQISRSQKRDSGGLSF